MADKKKEQAKRAQEKYRQTEKYLCTMWKNHLRRKYHMTIEDYDSLLVAQNYACRICGKIGADRGWLTKRQRINLFVDHCHITGKIRGLLCHNCNAGLGMFTDSIDTLSNAIAYLKENSLE